MIRSFDGELLNKLVNDPTIRPHAGGDGKSVLDFRPLMGGDNHFVIGDHGGIFYHWCAPDTYEVHIFVLPNGRGKWAYDFAQAGLQYARDIGAIHLWARVTTRLMRIFTLRTGFKFRCERVFDIGTGPVAYSIFDWRIECPQQ